MLDSVESLLLCLNTAVATTRTKEAFFTILTEQLRRNFAFDALAVIMLDTPDSYQKIWLGEFELVARPTATEPASLPSHRVRGTLVEELLAPGQPTTLDVAELALLYPEVLPLTTWEPRAITFLTAVPLRLNDVPVGMLCLAAHHDPAFTPAAFAQLASVGSLLAEALHNTLAFEDGARREREKTVQLLVNNALLSQKTRQELFLTVATELDRVVPCDHFLLWVRQPDGTTQGFAEFLRQPDGTFQPLPNNRLEGQPTRRRQQAQVFEHFLAGAAIYESSDATGMVRHQPARGWQPTTTRALLGVPLTLPEGLAGVLVLSSQRPRLFTMADLDLVAGLVPQIALAMQNLFAFEQIEALRAQLEREKTYLLNEINTSARFEDFVGPSAIMEQVQVRIRQVAPTPTTVLITGETGTGKELAARALHNLSPRRERPLIKLNCAALPAQLIESELFGHEKGAFTGAYDRRIGKFELADGGTIFLDEVGELPLDLQAKLLRVLQEKELERLGGRRVIRLDVRIIAATNRVLEDEVAAGRFRADLYYRLNVFPIRLPALRERPEDIEPLLRHALERLTKQLAKPVRGLRERDLRAMYQYAWPGNVRELEHVLERAIIVSQGPFLEIAGLPSTVSPGPANLTFSASGKVWAEIQSLQEVERTHIIAALRHTQGRVSGPNGAALLLNIKPSTLEARMKKHGIRRLIGIDAA